MIFSKSYFIFLFVALLIDFNHILHYCYRKIIVNLFWHLGMFSHSIILFLKHCFIRNLVAFLVSWALPCVQLHFWSENFFRCAEQNCCVYWITVTLNARVCNARSGKVDSSNCYLDRRPLHEINEIVYEHDKKHCQHLNM